MTQAAAPAPVDLGAVQAMIAQRKVVAFEKVRVSPEPSLPRNGVDAGAWVPDHRGLPPNCPVTPLGVSGSTIYLVDAIGQLVAIAPPYNKDKWLGAFGGDSNFLAWAWPRWAKKGIDGFAAEDVSRSVVSACFARGPWDPDRVRGRGAWRGRSGELILHRGTRVEVGARSEPPGEHAGDVYVTLKHLPGPVRDAIPESAMPARILKPMLRRWNWARPDVDPVLLMGWIGCALIGGALAQRPTVYLLGDKGIGKSTLNHLLTSILREYAVATTNTTAAGLYQSVGIDSRAIMVDEFGDNSDSKAAVKVLELARQSYSGGVMLRGSDRNAAISFQARSTFLFSSINTPPLEPQDLSRMAILSLRPVTQTGAELDVTSDAWGDVGRCILRRLIDEWPRWDTTLKAFRLALMVGGMDSRGADTFGTLLAMADMIEHVGWDEERLSTPTEAGDLVPWADLVTPSKMMEFEGADANWRKCLSWLLGARVDAWKSGHRVVVGQLLVDLMRCHDAVDDHLSEGEARTKLGQAGLGLVRRGEARDLWLAVPSNSGLVRQLYAGSKWEGVPGAGVWAGALRQSPYGAIHEVGSARVNGDTTTCTMIRLAGLYGPDGIMKVAREVV